MPIVNDTQTTLEFKGAKSVAIRGCKTADGDKRFCTLQICCRPAGGKQPPIAIIFRGTGKVLHKEKQFYDQSVHVYFQRKAWADRNFSVKWMQETRKNPRFLLMCDNLDSHCQNEFLDEIKSLNGSRYLLPAGETSKIEQSCA